MGAAISTSCDRVFCGNWCTSWGATDEQRNYWPPRHSGEPARPRAPAAQRLGGSCSRGKDHQPTAAPTASPCPAEQRPPAEPSFPKPPLLLQTSGTRHPSLCRRSMSCMSLWCRRGGGPRVCARCGGWRAQQRRGVGACRQRKGSRRVHGGCSHTPAATRSPRRPAGEKALPRRGVKRLCSPPPSPPLQVPQEQAGEAQRAHPLLGQLQVESAQVAGGLLRAVRLPAPWLRHRGRIRERAPPPLLRQRLLCSCLTLAIRWHCPPTTCLPFLLLQHRAGVLLDGQPPDALVSRHLCSKPG